MNTTTMTASSPVTHINWPPIRNWEISPIPGGWSAMVTLHDLRQPITGRSPRATVEAIAALLRNNDKPVNVEEIKAHLNAQWAPRAGDRWLGGVVSGSRQMAQPAPAETLITPIEWGRPLWESFNWTISARSLSAWQMMHGIVETILQSEEIGCDICTGHWRDFKRSHPVDLVGTIEDAAVWTWAAHDAANKHTGKRTRPSYHAIAAKFCWPPLTQHELQETLTRITRS